jgi:hypothetical protein
VKRWLQDRYDDLALLRHRGFRKRDLGWTVIAGLALWAWYAVNRPGGVLVFVLLGYVFVMHRGGRQMPAPDARKVRPVSDENAFRGVGPVTRIVREVELTDEQVQRLADRNALAWRAHDVGILVDEDGTIPEREPGEAAGRVTRRVRRSPPRWPRRGR